MPRSPASVIVTDDHQAPALAERYSPKPGHARPVLMLDLPCAGQADSKGTLFPDRCQSAALATAIIFGKPVGLEDVGAPDHDMRR